MRWLLTFLLFGSLAFGQTTKPGLYPLGPTGNLEKWDNLFATYRTKGYSKTEADMMVRADIAENQWTDLSRERDRLSVSDKADPKFAALTAQMKALAAECDALDAQAEASAKARIAAARKAAIEETPLRVAEAQERAAAELAEQTRTLRQIRDNQDAVNPNAPTRY